MYTLPALNTLPATHNKQWDFSEPTPSSKVLNEKPAVYQPVKKHPILHATPKIHYRVHNSLPLVPVLGQNNQVHVLTAYSLKISFNIIHHLRLRLPNDLSTGFLSKNLRVLLFDPMRATCPSIQPSSIWSPSHYTLFYVLLFPPSSLLRSKIALSTLFSNATQNFICSSFLTSGILIPWCRFQISELLQHLLRLYYLNTCSNFVHDTSIYIYIYTYIYILLSFLVHPLRNQVRDRVLLF
jgi:hypothetical protein